MENKPTELVLGAGSWGLAIAMALSRSKYSTETAIASQILIYSRNLDVVDDINLQRRHNSYDKAFKYYEKNQQKPQCSFFHQNATTDFANMFLSDVCESHQILSNHHQALLNREKTVHNLGNSIDMSQENVFKSHLEIERHRISQQNIRSGLLPENIRATASLDEAIEDATTIFIAVPLQNMRELCTNMRRNISDTNKFSMHKTIVLCSKGIERETGKLASGILQEFFPGNQFAILAGPNFAQEVLLDMPTMTTIASKSIQSAINISQLLSSKNFATEVSDDIIGIQMCSATKNIIAIGAGIIAALGCNKNLYCAYMTRAIQEIARIIAIAGGKSSTITTSAGVGDIILTCSSDMSRNYKFGYMLGSSFDNKQNIELPNELVEGYHTARAILSWFDGIGNLSQDIVICRAVADIISRYESNGYCINLYDIEKFLKVIV